jgi:PPOX class probable F420-dependent enzyme
MPRRYTKAETDRFLSGRHVAVLATVAADGSPMLTPIWYLYRDGRILMRTDKQSVKTRNIERDPRVTVCVQDERAPYASVTVYGKAVVEPAHEGLGAVMAKHTSAPSAPRATSGQRAKRSNEGTKSPSSSRRSGR